MRRISGEGLGVIVIVVVVTVTGYKMSFEGASLGFSTLMNGFL